MSDWMESIIGEFVLMDFVVSLKRTGPDERSAAYINDLFRYIRMAGSWFSNIIALQCREKGSLATIGTVIIYRELLNF